MGRRHGKTIRDAFSAPSGETPRQDEVLSALLPELRQLDRQAMRIKTLPLTDIRPDPVQPRRSMPEELRREWIAKPQDIQHLLDLWLEQANQYAERYGRPLIDPVAILTNQNHDDETSHEAVEPDPVEANFLKLLYDAATVYDHGLEHPISVVRERDVWRLESGERRTLMFWALVHWVDSERWSRIPAVEVEQRSVWRQAAENNARQDLNAIERARQLALLLMDCYPDQAFASILERPGQAFYQQAVELRVPYGKSGEFLAVMGLSDNAQIRRFRQLLLLPSDVWLLADELGWTEFKLRGMMQVARNAPAGMSEDEYLSYLAKVEAGMLPPPNPENVPTGTILEEGQGDRSIDIDYEASESVPAGTNLDRLWRRADGHYRAIMRVAKMSDDELALLDEARRKEMVQAAREIIQRFGGAGSADDPSEG